jgi:hypothetical protein
LYSATIAASVAWTGMMRDGDEIVTLARHSPRRVVDAILEVHNNPAVIRRALVPDEAIAPYVIVTSKYSLVPQRRNLTPDELAKLEAADAHDLILPPKSETSGYTRDGRRTAPEPHRYAGLALGQGSSVAMRRDRWEAILYVDPAVADMVSHGQIDVQHLTTEEARTFTSVAGGQP